MLENPRKGPEGICYMPQDNSANARLTMYEPLLLVHKQLDASGRSPTATCCPSMPSWLLMDEPTSALNVQARIEPCSQGIGQVIVDGTKAEPFPRTLQWPSRVLAGPLFGRCGIRPSNRTSLCISSRSSVTMAAAAGERLRLR